MQARRGYVPKDDRYFSKEALPTLVAASEHIRYLLDAGYGLRQATTFVGDHFQLSERQRVALMRSVATKGQLAARRAKVVPLEGLSSQEVWVDGFNTIITLEVMLCDSTLLDCMDGSIRDLASLRGTYRIISVTEGSVRLLLDTLRDARVSSVNVLLDRPVSNSGRLRALIEETARDYPFAVNVQVTDGVDALLFGRGNVIGSDSVVLDRCASWVMLARHCLEARGARALRLW